jgi:DNA-binding CsgD family transcriptional regulator
VTRRPAQPSGPREGSGAGENSARRRDCQAADQAEDHTFTGFETSPGRPTDQTMEQLAPATPIVARSDIGSPDRGKCLRPALSTYEAELSLFKAFLDLREHGRGALVALSARLVVSNRTASEVLQPGDWPRLWALAQDVLDEGRPRGAVVPLRNGTSVLARCRPIMKARLPVGALLQFSVPAGGLMSRDRGSIPGWSKLTDAERGLAELVARGFTNGEAGKRTFVSRHTVDAHLRNVFRKLGISTRAELARLVGEHHLDLCSPEDFPVRYCQPRPVAEHQETRSA